MANTKVLKSTMPKFHCERCDYTCSNKSNFNKHCGTRKHIILTNPNKMLQERDVGSYDCVCGNTYKHKSSLSAHKKRCTSVALEPEPAITASMFMKVLDDNKELRDLLCLQQSQFQQQMRDQQEQMKDQQVHSDKKQIELLGQLKEQQKQMAELIPKVGSHNTTNNNNQRFNLQFFLNETCKDAINWDDFVRSIEVGSEEFDAMASSSMTEGVAKVICHGIQDLGVYKRPIHCVDMKRRKMCIKEEDAWNHDEDDVDGMLRSANESTKGKYNQVLCQWEKDHPKWQDDEEETNTYLHLLGKVIESMDDKKCAIEIAKNTMIPKDSGSS